MIYQGLYFGLMLGLMNRKADLREMFWLVFATGLFTLAGAVLFPALGPFKSLAAGPAHSFLPEMEHLKSGRDLNFALAHLIGVVSFPSFHTSMALAYAWGFRRTGAIGWAIAALNLLMLAAIPWFGGHYLTDMIAGAAVMLLSLGIVKGFAKLRANAANASPRYAAASDGAY
jgi:membrane-associated phospholipid phosphatase